MDTGFAGGESMAGPALSPEDWDSDGSVVPPVQASDDRGGGYKIDGIDGWVSGISHRNLCCIVRIFHWGRSGFSENADMQESASASYVFFCLYQAVIPDK